MNNTSLNKNKWISIIISIVLSVAAFIAFLVNTGLVTNALLLVAISIFIIFPFRKSIKIIKYYIATVIIVLVCWMLAGIGSTLFPFIFAIITGYLLNPLVAKLEQKKMPRWASATIVMVLFCGLLALVGIFLFPIIFQQLETIANQISAYITAVPEYVRSGKFDALLNKLGIPKSSVDYTITHEILPRVENIISVVLDSIMKILLSFSTLATQVVNVVITPFLMFYFLKDFGKIKSKISWILKKENKNLHKYVKKFDSVLRIYTGWQLIASGIVITISSISFSIFSVPYGILLACIAACLNPIPYFGSILSVIISSFVLLLVNDGNAAFEIMVVICTIIGIHFINAYFLEPTVAGEKVGLHPVLMILSVFLFSSLFGIPGMLVAVPITAVLVTILQDVFNEHYAKYEENEIEEKNQ